MATSNVEAFEELKVDSRVISYVWRIDNFLTNRPYLKGVVYSRIFPPNSLPQWLIRLDPRDVVSTKDLPKLGLHLVLKKAEKDKSPVVDFSLKYLNDDGNAIRFWKFPQVNFAKTNSCGFNAGGFFERIPVSESGKLIIQVDITINGEIYSGQHPIPIEIPKSPMNEQLQKLFASGEHSDFNIESQDGRIFAAHKRVLASQSVVFGRIVQSPMGWMTKNHFKLPFDGEIVAAMMEFLYTDGVANLSTIATELIKVAHKYQMARLTSLCATELISSLNVDNFTVALSMAKRYGLDSLLSACENFLKDHPAVAIRMVISGEGQVETSEDL